MTDSAMCTLHQLGCNPHHNLMREILLKPHFTGEKTEAEKVKSIVLNLAANN